MKGCKEQLSTSRIAVVAKRVGNTNRFMVQPGKILVVPAGTKLIHPDKITVLTEEGEELIPTGHYAVTEETINPFHIICDIF